MGSDHRHVGVDVGTPAQGVVLLHATDTKWIFGFGNSISGTSWSVGHSYLSCAMANFVPYEGEMGELGIGKLDLTQHEPDGYHAGVP